MLVVSVFVCVHVCARACMCWCWLRARRGRLRLRGCVLECALSCVLESSHKGELRSYTGCVPYAAWILPPWSRNLPVAMAWQWCSASAVTDYTPQGKSPAPVAARAHYVCPHDVWQSRLRRRVQQGAVAGSGSPAGPPPHVPPVSRTCVGSMGGPLCAVRPPPALPACQVYVPAWPVGAPCVMRPT